MFHFDDPSAGMSAVRYGIFLVIHVFSPWVPYVLENVPSCNFSTFVMKKSGIGLSSLVHCT